MNDYKDLNTSDSRDSFTMIRGNRLSDLSKEDRLRFYNFLDIHKKDKDLLTQIRTEFGLDYNRTSMRYLHMMCNRKTELKHIEKDNKVMEKWKIPDNPANSPNYADFLGDLAYNRITNDDFIENTQSIRF